MKNMNIKSTKKYEKKKKILASEVSGKTSVKANFDDSKKRIEEAEIEAQARPSKKVMQELIDLY
jgi:hypothetical protein